jgi:hypothetical protein
MKHLNRLLIAIILVIVTPFQINAQEVDTECKDSYSGGVTYDPVAPPPSVFVNIEQAKTGGYLIPQSGGTVIVRIGISTALSAEEWV